MFAKTSQRVSSPSPCSESKARSPKSYNLCQTSAQRPAQPTQAHQPVRTHFPMASTLTLVRAHVDASQSTLLYPSIPPQPSTALHDCTLPLHPPAAESSCSRAPAARPPAPAPAPPPPPPAPLAAPPPAAAPPAWRTPPVDERNEARRTCVTLPHRLALLAPSAIPSAIPSARSTPSPHPPPPLAHCWPPFPST